MEDTRQIIPSSDDTFAAIAAMKEEERRKQEALQLELQAQYSPTSLGLSGPDYPQPGEEQAAIEALQQAGPPQPAAEPFREFTGEKYQTREDGSTQQTDEYNKYLQAEANVRAFDENPIVQTLQGASDVAMDIAQGTGDTLFGTLKGMGWLAGGGQNRLGLDKVDDYWHQLNPQSDNGAHHAVRKMWGVIGPSVIIPAATLPKLAALPFAAHIPGAAKTTAAFAYTMGIDAAVFNSSTSSYDENAAKALNDWLHWDLPNATPEGASADERWKYNQTENLGFSAAGGLIQGLAALNTWRKALKASPKKNVFEATWLHKWDTTRYNLNADGIPTPGTKIE